MSGEVLQLSGHFSLAELTRSATADAYRLDNTPPPEIVAHLKRSAELLEPVRALLAQPIRITSGYRSPAVNKAVGGSPTSAHGSGYAIDLVCPNLSAFEVCRRIAEAGIRFDQLIHEYGRWTHISFDPRMRGKAMTIASARGGYLENIRPVRTA